MTPGGYATALSSGIAILFGIGLLVGVELGRAFSFWKW